MPGRSAIVGLLKEVNRHGKRAARRAARVYTRSVHVHQAAESSSPASPAPLHAHIPMTNWENVRMVPCLAARREQWAARRNSPHFLPGRWQSPYSSLMKPMPVVFCTVVTLNVKNAFNTAKWEHICANLPKSATKP